MDVDEAQRDTLSSGVDGFRGLRRRNVRRNRGDLAVLDRDIANGVNVVPGVDDVAARDQQVVRRLLATPDASRQNAILFITISPVNSRIQRKTWRATVCPSSSSLTAAAARRRRPATGLLKDVVVALLLQLRRQRSVDLAELFPGTFRSFAREFSSVTCKRRRRRSAGDPGHASAPVDS